MISSFFVKKIVSARLGFIPIILFPFLVSCASNDNNSVEIIIPPKFPEVFSSIPENTDKPDLIPLLSTDEKIKNISVGRHDPFLPPLKEGDQLLVPSSFVYHGQASSGEFISAFVSYEDRRGVVKPGDIGGEHTDLLPNGWTILNLDNNTKVLTLGFEDRSVNIDLFPEN